MFAILAGAAIYAERQAVRAQQEANAQREQALSAKKRADDAAQQALLAQKETERHGASLLAEIGTSQRLTGNLDTALRLGVRAVSVAYALDQRGTETLVTADALAASVWESEWRLLLVGHDATVNSAAFSFDGTRIVTASRDETARIWDAASGRQIAVLPEQANAVNSAAFSPDGTRIVTALSDKTACIWDAATDKEIAVLRGHEEAVTSAAFSPDGTRIVTASDDHTARIWKAANGKQIAVHRGHEDDVS
ncbi:MAG: WD40 repeat domain-containing protein [Steroidobacteraceae bacterium]